MASRGALFSSNCILGWTGGHFVLARRGIFRWQFSFREAIKNANPRIGL
jgi:hypothetical protein